MSISNRQFRRRIFEVFDSTQTMRMVSEHAADRETMAMYGPGPDGKEYKMGELVYTRRK